MHISRVARTFALAALGSGMVTAPALAQEDPVYSCPPGQEVGTDVAGDAKLYNVIPAPASVDLRKVELAAVPETGAARVTLTVENLDKTVPPNSTGLSWYLEYKVDGAARFVAATLAPDGSVSYDTGTDGQAYTPTGTTSGTFTEGPGGKITIDIPDAYWGADLTTMRAATYEAIGATIPGVGTAAFLPGADAATVSNYSVPECTEVPAA
jgi:hypothetical protein